MADETTFCGACGLFFDNVDRIITCGRCDMIYHSRCVDATAAENEWCCPEGCWCEEDKEAQSNNNNDGSTNSSEEASEMPDAATEPEKPEVVKVALDQHAEQFDAERWIREKQLEIEVELAERQARIDRELQAKEKKMTEAIRKKMRRYETNVRLEQRKKSDHNRRMAELDSSYRRRSSLIDEQLELIKFGFEKLLPSPQIVDLAKEEEEDAENETDAERDENSSDPGEESDGSLKVRAEDTSENETKLLMQDFVSISPNGLGQQCSGFEKARLAAGGGLTRQSPCYPIDPVQWPKSLGTREGSSTHGVTDERNLVGFRHLLEGGAQNTGHFPRHLSEPDIVKRHLSLECPELLPQCRLEEACEAERSVDGLEQIKSLEIVEDILREQMEGADLTLENPLTKQDPASVLLYAEQRLWAPTRSTEPKIFLLTNPETIAGTSRRGQIEEAALYCLKEDSSGLSRANQMPHTCDDHQWRFGEGIEKLSVDVRMQLVANWKFGDDLKCQLEKFGQRDACRELHILVTLPLVSTVDFSPQKEFTRDASTADAATSVALIECAQAVRPVLGSVRAMLCLQQMAETRGAWPRITRNSGWNFAVRTTGGEKWLLSSVRQKPHLSHHMLKAEELSAHNSIDVAADDARREEFFGELRSMESVVAVEVNLHQASFEDLDSPKEHSTLLSSAACAQQDPASTDRTTLINGARDSKNAGRDKGGSIDKLLQNNSTPLRNPSVGLLPKGSRIPTNAEVDYGGGNYGVGNQPCAMASARAVAYKQDDLGLGIPDSTARLCAAQPVIVVEQLAEHIGVQKPTTGNVRKTTNLDATKRNAMDNNKYKWAKKQINQVKHWSIGNRPQQVDLETGNWRCVAERKTVNAAVIEIFGKSDAPDGPTDVTGWGVTTAETGAMPDGGGPTV
ncbi:uncharacterized protein LOC119767822 [Culex quinquefasciatus]|uniref:uncharacterized protein LOC119767822 n=1 Tax=Culex quinquefasciatus TaxID=7176 RepID=UPI0018E2B2E7|nr:uncharacterized protein LOC119767822 [Culex quinquefasciatus]XP_038113328.1 uncharacterized protein LOC119767822 [Culex quinquefasciatus]